MKHIEHVVIIFKENHTFDNYFGTFPHANGEKNLAHASDPPLSDQPHTHKAWVNRNTKPIKLQYHESDIPGYFALAKQFTLCDNYFTDVAGPSTPNHLMVIAADSPIIDNPHPKDLLQPQPPYTLPSLPEQLEKSGLTWGSYGSYAHQFIKHLQKSPNNHASSTFLSHVASGTLPAVSWVYGPKGSSEHPVESVAMGEQWTIDQIKALIKNGYWKNTAIFITWDDWGGWYDHVTPPELEKWKDGSQFRYGSRVGCIVVSPFAKAGYISSELNSHVSIVKFVEDTFSLPSLNNRTNAANGMKDCFDFAQSPLSAPTGL